MLHFTHFTSKPPQDGPRSLVGVRLTTSCGLLAATALALALVATTPALGAAPDRPPGQPLGDSGTGTLAGTSGAAGATPSANTSGRSGTGLGTANTLILYDTTGAYGWLGETYATFTANLASHFGSWTAKPVSSYKSGELNSYTATIYIGSTYDEPLPAVFLEDAGSAARTRPLIWIYDNIWQLASRNSSFQRDYGFMPGQFDLSDVSSIIYKGRSLTRSLSNRAGIMGYASLDPGGAKVLADAVRPDGSTFPWAVRSVSRNLTYVGEIPFAYTGESDRLIAFEDMLFDALAPSTPERHRALLRLEDINPESDPAELRAVADYLSSKGIPYGFGVSPRYEDPLGYYNGGTSQRTRLRDRPGLVSAIKYLQSHGGTMIEHGWTHQYSNVRNPYSGVSGDDFEFYRVVENLDHTLTYQGPVAEDSANWADRRLNSAGQDFTAAGLAIPSIFEFPHYAGSVLDYGRVAQRFQVGWDRRLYPSGVLTGSTPDYQRLGGQMFPYPVKDVYGTKILPENLGNIEPEPFFQFPPRSPAQIVEDAKRNLAIRDSFASFYFHPFFSLDLLGQTVEGIQGLGYTFVDPRTL